MKFSLASTVISATSLAAIKSAQATNFIVIQPDDMAFYEDWDPPAYLPWGANYPGVEYPTNSVLPWINKLKNEGMWMTQAYAAAPKCGTSRYSTVTGRYPSRAATARKSAKKNNQHPVKATIGNTKLDDFGANRVTDGQDCSQSNIAQVFRKNGYATGIVGKWHLTNTDNAGGTVAGVKAKVESCGFQNVTAMYPDNFDGIGGWDDGLHHNMEYVAYKAVEFIENNQGNDWFLYMNPTVPHGPTVADAFDVDCRLTTDGDFTGSMSNGWSVIGMTAEHGDNCTAYRDDVRDRAGTDADDDLGSIWVDDAIGAIHMALNRTGQLDDTFILFQLDHGKVNKDEIWEGGVRIPQFVYHPNGNYPSTFEGLVSTIDIGPTILDIAGLSEANAVTGSWYDMDGKSWKTAVQNQNGEEADWRDNRCLFFESGDERAVRCGCDKYMLLDSASPELTEAASSSWTGWTASSTEALFDLCDNTRSYISASPSDESPEATNIVLSETQKAADMAELMECHLNRTDARQSDVVAPEYVECTGAIATPSPTVTSQPTTPVANNGGVPLYLDSSPWQNDIEATATSFVLSATVIDDDLARVRFNILYPDSTMSGFSGGTEVSTSGDKSTYEFQVDTTASTGKGPGKYGYKIRMVDSSGNSVDYPTDGSFIQFVVADSAAEVVAAARTEIASIITQNMATVNLAAKFLRHSFHDCVGGCDGCVDMTNDDNAGLDVPIAALEPVVEMFSHFGVTRADIWVLAGLEAVRGQQSDGDADNREFAMQWIGRPNCEDINLATECVENTCSQDRGPVRDLPSPSLDTHDLLEYFSTEFDFDERDTVAIMGAHTLGTLVKENSGYNGVNGWLGNTRLFANGYYDSLAGGANASDTFEEFMNSPNWQQVFVDNSNLTTPDRWEWERGSDPHFVMINSDMALVRNLTGEIDPVTGEVANCQIRCNRANLDNCSPKRCPHAPETFDIVVEYKFDNGQFLMDFEDAFMRMLNKGHTATSPTVDGCDVDLTPPCNVEVISRRNLRGSNN